MTKSTGKEKMTLRRETPKRSQRLLSPRLLVLKMTQADIMYRPAPKGSLLVTFQLKVLRAEMKRKRQPKEK